jgi:Fur family transcriptional regulator, ferric uptake regulator
MRTDPERWLAHTDAVLRAAGLRAGPGRTAVAEVLARGECLMSAQDIAATLDAQTTRSASPATVYRTLDLLHEHGLIRRIDAGERIARYEPLDPAGGDDHQHVLFDDGSVVPFEDPELTDVMAGLGERHGFRITSYELIVHARR